MTDVDKERYFRLADIARLITIGYPVDRRTVHRWATRGRRKSDGTQAYLKTTKLFGVLHSRLIDVEEFAKECNLDN